MANYVNKIAVLDDGKTKKVTAADNLQVSGSFTAGSFAGNGASLTNLNAGALSGTLPALDGSALTNLDASDLASGTIPNERFPSTLPAASGANLTALNASNLASGTIPNERFPSTLPAVSGANLTDLDASDLASGTVPSGVVSGQYTGVTGVGTLTAGAIGTGFTAIADTHLATIASSGKVQNSATTATSANTNSAIVARDASGNFSAGTITAALAGNASTATSATSADSATVAGKWSSPISIGFSSGDVSGTISSLDGSASLSSVALTIGDGAVTNAKLAGNIEDSKLNSIASSGKVQNSATTATSANTNNAIVARDASGNFSANIVTASLNGNASTANQWSSARSVSFSGGDVTGSFSIDGSAAVPNVSLTIGSAVVDNAMLAGSISDDKLLQITSANKVADTALSSNVPLLDADLNDFTGSVNIQGSLNVVGPIISGGEVNVIVRDAFLDLSAGNIGTVSKASGFCFNIKKATGFTAETATAFNAGVVSTSAPTMEMSDSSLLAAGDIIEIHNTVGGVNDGLYVVASKSGTGSSTVVTIKGIGGTPEVLPAAYVPFVGNQFSNGTAETATVIKVDLAAFAVSNGSLSGSSGAITTGTFCYNYQAAATESSFSGTWTSLSAVTTPTLAEVYASGGSAAVVLTNSRDFTISKPVIGSAAISLEANAASTMEVVGAQLNLKTSGAAADVVLSASQSVKVASPLMLPTGNGTTVVSSGVGFIQSVAAGVSEGDLLYIDTDGVAKQAVNISGSNPGRKAQVVALEANGGASAELLRVTAIRGAKVYISVTGGATAGDTLYLSATAGQASKSAPTTGLLQSLGEVIGAAIGTHYPVIFEPRVIADDLGAA
jgi:hypothetical protein